jgi:hypothetical protein
VGTLISITMGAGGSGYANGWHYLAFSGGGGSGATGEFFVSGGVVQSVWLTNGGSGYTSAPTVSFPDPNGTGATASVAVGTGATFAGVANGSYTLDASATDYSPTTGTALTIPPCPTTGVAITLVPTKMSLTFGEASPCDQSTPLPGVTCTVTQTGFFGSCTTDGTGFCTVPGITPSVSTTITASLPPRFDDVSVTLGSGFPWGCDAPTGVVLTVNSGYVCIGTGHTACAYPVSKTLQLHDPYLGVTTTLTFNAGTNTWIGSNAVTFPGCAATACPTGGATITYEYTPIAPLTITCASATPPNSLCPGSGGAIPLRGRAISSSFTCPPSFLDALDVDFTFGDGPTIYCLTPTTLTVTE